MKRAIALLAIAMLYLLNTVQTEAQGNIFWSSHTDGGTIVTDKAVARLSFPTEFKLFNLNIEPLRQELFSVVDNNAKHSTIISLPNADGAIEQFEVFEASNFEPDLQARFPEIRAFSGKGITDTYATLKLSISPQGIQTMVFRTDRENEFIEAYSEDHTVYAVFKSQRRFGQLAWTCSTEDKKIYNDINAGVSPLSSTGELRTMRLAQSCNGEYSNYFGATSASQVALVLAAYNATLTRCNGCYEKDLALHLNLIAATTNVIYYNPATDPYTTLSNWNSQLQSTLTSVIGEANYDIGHMFGASGGGGNAGCIGCVCVNGQKGSGITSPADGIPQGDNFDIDYVVHEVGHQLGANHTFSYSNEGAGVSKEVGAGITIMGYAGITSYDPAPHSIDIYHEASIAQIQSNLAGKACPVTTNISTNNATPVVAAVSNYTIPISTPFALTGSATDANGDALTYCWEQNDNTTTTGANSVASATKTTGPNWISFSPTASPTRYFPRLSTILAGLLITPTLGGDAVCNVEALSSVSRTLNFRLTVRDNCPYSSTPPLKIGQTQFTDMVVTVTNTSGPFQVSSPNTSVSWAGGSTQAITWLVNNTNTGAVNCANVKISLSTDGGQTFPTVLAASTPNDGSEALTIPNSPTTTARVKVEAVGNIFFDISNANFTITASTLSAPTLVFPSDNATQQPVSLTLRWNTVASATSYRLQVGTDSTFAGGMVVNDSTLTDTTRLVSGISSNTKYFWRVNAKNGSGTSGYSSLRRFTTVTPPAATTLISPADNATGLANSLTLRWNTSSLATSYKLQLATDSTFATGMIVNDSTLTDTSRLVSGLSYSTRHFWRVYAINGVGTGPSSSLRRFTTLATPPAVVLVSPPDNATGQANSLTLRWNTASTATSYRLQVSSDSTFAGGLVNDSTMTDTSQVVSGLLYNTRYFWRVNGLNVAGMGAASTLRRFTTLTPPTAVSLVSPANNATGQPSSLTFRWNQAPTATSYILHVSTDSTFASGLIVSDSTLTDTSRAVSGLLLNTTYFWRVTGQNVAGTGSASVVRRLTTLTPPATVTLVFPANNATGQPSSLTFRWNQTPTATSYILHVSADSTFAGGLVVSDSTLTDTSRVVSGLLLNTVYFWRVTGQNIAGTGSSSIVRRLTTLTPPPVVTLVFPADNATEQPVSLTVRWSATSTATSYILQVSTDSTFTGGLFVNDSTITDTSKLVSGLSPNTMYFWRVNGQNAAGIGSASSVRQFTTLTPPTSITLVSPSDNATGQAISLTLRWNTAPTATSYRVQVSTDSIFTGLVVDDSTVTDTSKLVGGLSFSTLYFWRVSGQNIAGTGAPSLTRRFTTLVPPSAVTLVSPPDNATNQALSLTLRWNAITTATSYKLQVATDSTFGGGLIVNDSTLTDTSKLVSGLAPSTTYFWRVNGRNAAGNGAPSVVRRFTTLVPPATVILAGPATDTTISTSSITLLWHSVVFASKYSVEWSLDSLFASSFVDSSLTDTSKVVGSLADSSTYYWKARAGNIAGWGPVSSVRRFSTVLTNTVCSPMLAGWNLVSLPVTVANDSAQSVFPTCGSSGLFAFVPGSGYQQRSVVLSGNGYWIKCIGDPQCITGTPILRDTIAVQAGWNLIGTLSVPINAASATSIPSGIISSNFFGFNNGYMSSAVLSAGSGYWVKVSQAGVIILDGSSVVVARPHGRAGKARSK